MQIELLLLLCASCMAIRTPLVYVTKQMMTKVSSFAPSQRKRMTVQLGFLVQPQDVVQLSVQLIEVEVVEAYKDHLCFQTKRSICRLILHSLQNCRLRFEGDPCQETRLLRLKLQKLVVFLSIIISRQLQSQAKHQRTLLIGVVVSFFLRLHHFPLQEVKVALGVLEAEQVVVHDRRGLAFLDGPHRLHQSRQTHRHLQNLGM